MAEPDPFKALADYVELEIAAATARKSSFETRSFSIITLNLGLFTLFFALQTQISIAVHSYPRVPMILFIIAIVCSIVSMALATASTFPFKYPIPRQQAFDRRFKQAQENLADRHRQDILKLRIHQLNDATDKNQIKGGLLYAAVVMLGLAACLMITTLTWVLIVK